MCYKVVERYSVCKCVYFQHSIDPCSAYGQRGHGVQEKTVLVGYACARHSAHAPPPRFAEYWSLAGFRVFKFEGVGQVGADAEAVSSRFSLVGWISTSLASLCHANTTLTLRYTTLCLRHATPLQCLIRSTLLDGGFHEILMMRNVRQCLIHASLAESSSTTSPLVGEIVPVAFAFALLCFALLSDWILGTGGGIVFPGEIQFVMRSGTAV